MPLKIEPCDQCANTKCDVHRWLLKNFGKLHVWDLDAKLRQRTVTTSIERAIPPSELVLECAAFNSNVPDQEDYSQLLGRTTAATPCNDCKCKGGCK